MRIELVESWGSDSRIIESTRMSTSGKARGFPEDRPLLRYLWQVTVKTPQSIGWNKPTIECFAEEIAAELELQPGGDLIELVRELGGRVTYRSAEDSMGAADGSLWVEGPNSFTIKLSAFTGQARDRFTIAHELGHYFLHSNQGERRIVAERQGSGRVDWEANWFAAAFLMPEAPFRHRFTLSGGAVGAVAAHFHVSVHAAEIRAKRLGLAGEC